MEPLYNQMCLQDGVWAASASVESRMGKGTDAKPVS